MPSSLDESINLFKTPIRDVIRSRGEYDSSAVPLIDLYRMLFEENGKKLPKIVMRHSVSKNYTPKEDERIKRVAQSKQYKNLPNELGRDRYAIFVRIAKLGRLDKEFGAKAETARTFFERKGSEENEGLKWGYEGFQKIIGEVKGIREGVLASYHPLELRQMDLFRNILVTNAFRRMPDMLNRTPEELIVFIEAMRKKDSRNVLFHSYKMGQALEALHELAEENQVGAVKKKA